MDHNRFPKRSASHGTLRGSYAYHGRPTTGPNTGTGMGSSLLQLPHKPLRSVKENSVLLQSPGALESMLKTTTETGDIGIFSIRPMTSPRRRGAFTNTGTAQLRPRRSVDEIYGHYHRGRLPGNRDTTSEILSMYASESQRSLASNFSPTSTGDIGPRSLSMTTCESRHIPHYSSTTTLQSQASQTSGSSLLQRPRSPFPYPTRLKRPGVRPASPALTDTGHVDYRRRVEIDRISLVRCAIYPMLGKDETDFDTKRTLHGAYRPIYPPGPRRYPPLGPRMDNNGSVPPLYRHGSPSIRQSPRGPPSIRSQSAASVSSRHAPHRVRLDSTSTRASSLTSIVNMYHRMPQPLLDGHSGLPVPDPPPVPLYYDYTECFEPEFRRNQAHTQFPVSFPVHAMDDHRLVVHSLESEGFRTPKRSHKDSPFFDGGNQRTGGDHVTEALRVMVDTEAEIDRDTGTISRDQQQLQSRRSSAQSYNDVAGLEHSEAGRGSLRRSRGSDIDLLPSQIGRDSMDTFNPNLDIESRDAPTYNYSQYRANATPKTKTNTPEKQVQVQDIGAPSIRSEQGIILRDDFLENILDTPGSGEQSMLHSEPVEMQTRELESAHERRSISAPVQDCLEESDQRRYCRRFNTSNIGNSDGQDYGSSTKETSDQTRSPGGTNSYAHDNKATTPLLQGLTTRNDLELPKTRKNLQKNKGHAHENESHEQFRRHKRNNAAFKINNINSPRDANEGFPHINTRCSTTPIISPKPISPARQLRVKNSIPHLMKALPPLPGDPGYTADPTPPTTGVEDDFAEILAPSNFGWPFAFGQNKNSSAAKANPDIHADHTGSLQKNTPKLRLKMRLTETSAPTRGDNRPWTSDSNTTKTSAQTDIENARLLKGRLLQSPMKSKLRSHDKAIDTPHSFGIRREAATRKSEGTTEMADQQPRDPFSLRSGVSSAIRQISRKAPLTNQAGQPDGSSRAPVRREVSAPAPRVRLPWTQNHIEHPTSNITLNGSKPHGLRKRLSNLRSLLARQAGFTSGADAAPITRANAAGQTKAGGEEPGIGLTNLNASGQQTTSRGRCPANETPHPRFSQRMRAKLRRWVEGAKLAVRTCSE